MWKNDVMGNSGQAVTGSLTHSVCVCVSSCCRYVCGYGGEIKNPKQK